MYINIYVYFNNTKFIIKIKIHYIGICTVAIFNIVEKPKCWSNPCKNRGTCINTRKKTYICKCAGGYKGVNCETGKYDVRTVLWQ